MDLLKAMTVFVRIADSGSLTAAAHLSNQSPASVVRSLAALEQHLGVRLINRTTRRMALTEEGTEYLAWCRRMLSEFDGIENHLDARRESPSGLIRVTAPVELGRRHVSPLINTFMSSHKGVNIDLMLSDGMVDLIEEGLDLGIRIGHLPDSSTISETVGYTRPVVCVSPSFLDGNPEINQPSDLKSVDCTVFIPHNRRWEFRSNGHSLIVEPYPRLTTNDVASAIAACRDGVGVGRFFHYQVADDLASGKLVRLLSHFEPENIPVQLVYPHRRLISPRVRYLLDWLNENLSETLKIPDER